MEPSEIFSRLQKGNEIRFSRKEKQAAIKRGTLEYLREGLLLVFQKEKSVRPLVIVDLADAQTHAEDAPRLKRSFFAFRIEANRGVWEQTPEIEIPFEILFVVQEEQVRQSWLDVLPPANAPRSPVPTHIRHKTEYMRKLPADYPRNKYHKFTGWKKRYFVLDGSKLAYYASVSSRVPKGTIFLWKYYEVSSKGLPKFCDPDCSFQLLSETEKTFYVTAADRSVRDVWVDVLGTHLRTIRGNRDMEDFGEDDYTEDRVPELRRLEDIDFSIVGTVAKLDPRPHTVFEFELTIQCDYDEEEVVTFVRTSHQIRRVASALGRLYPALELWADSVLECRYDELNDQLEGDNDLRPLYQEKFRELLIVPEMFHSRMFLSFFDLLEVVEPGDGGNPEENTSDSEAKKCEASTGTEIHRRRAFRRKVSLPRRSQSAPSKQRVSTNPNASMFSDTVTTSSMSAIDPVQELMLPSTVDDEVSTRERRRPIPVLSCSALRHANAMALRQLGGAFEQVFLPSVDLSKNRSVGGQNGSPHGNFTALRRWAGYVLPYVVCLRILRHFTPKELCLLSKVSSSFYRLTSDPLIWRQLCLTYLSPRAPNRLIAHLAEVSPHWKRNYEALSLRHRFTELIGANYAATVTEDGQLLVWGRNEEFPLPRDGPVARPLTGLEGLRVASVSVGTTHLVAVSDAGDAYIWGYWSRPFRPHGPSTDRVTAIEDASSPFERRSRHVHPNDYGVYDRPTRIDGPHARNVVSVSCGENHNAMITASGRVYVWGYSEYGVLGIPLDELDRAVVEVPTLVPSLRNVSTISCGSRHTVAISEGMVYSWGSGVALGQGSERMVVETPSVVPGTSEYVFVDVSAGHVHTAAITDGGGVFTWGIPSRGRLGHGKVHLDLVDLARPRRVAALIDEVVVSISAGFSHTLALTNEGKVYAWGATQFSLTQTEKVDSFMPRPVASLKNISSVNAGNLFSIFISTEGKTYVWGEGSFGEMMRGGSLCISTSLHIPKPVPSLRYVRAEGLSFVNVERVRQSVMAELASRLKTQTEFQQSTRREMEKEQKRRKRFEKMMEMVAPEHGEEETEKERARRRRRKQLRRARPGKLGRPYWVNSSSDSDSSDGEMKAVTTAELSPAGYSELEFSEPGALGYAYVGQGMEVVEAEAQPRRTSTSPEGPEGVSTTVLPKQPSVSSASSSTTTVTTVTVVEPEKVEGAETVVVLPTGRSVSNPLIQPVLTPGEEAMLTERLFAPRVERRVDDVIEEEEIDVSSSHHSTLESGSNPGSPSLSSLNSSSEDELPCQHAAGSPSESVGDETLGNLLGELERDLDLDVGRGSLFEDPLDDALDQQTRKVAVGFRAIMLTELAGTCSAFLAESGELYLSGVYPELELATNCTSLQSVEALVSFNVVGVSVSPSHFAVVTEYGGLFTWGRGLENQLGHSAAVTVRSPALVHALSAHRIITASAGLEHTVAVNEFGQCFAWGCNRDGRLGLGDERDRACPCVVSSECKFLSVCAGGRVTLGLSESRKVWSWGAAVPALGHPENTVSGENVLSPKMVEALSDVYVQTVSVRFDHCVAISDDGYVFTWGSGQDGRLGHGHPCVDVDVPTIVESLKSHIVVCGCAGKRHSCCVTNAGVVLVWGWGMNGCLGHARSKGGAQQRAGLGASDQLPGEEEEVSEPRVVKALMGRKVSTVACGELHSIAIGDFGGVYTWGLGLGGRLGHGTQENVAQPKQVTALEGFHIRGSRQPVNLDLDAVEQDEMTLMKQRRRRRESNFMIREDDVDRPVEPTDASVVPHMPSSPRGQPSLPPDSNAPDEEDSPSHPRTGTSAPH